MVDGTSALARGRNPFTDGLVNGDANGSSPEASSQGLIAVGGSGNPATHMAMPRLLGAPAYARPPRLVIETPRPFDPDDLPLEAMRGPEDLALLSEATVQAHRDEPILTPSSQGGLRAVASRIFGSGS
jgi:hypothetical protein